MAGRLLVDREGIEPSPRGANPRASRLGPAQLKEGIGPSGGLPTRP